MRELSRVVERMERSRTIAFAPPLEVEVKDLKPTLISSLLAPSLAINTPLRILGHLQRLT
jgi:hypothetical protein